MGLTTEPSDRKHPDWRHSHTGTVRSRPRTGRWLKAPRASVVPPKWDNHRHSLFTLLLYRSIHCRPTRLQSSFFPSGCEPPELILNTPPEWKKKKVLHVWCKDNLYFCIEWQLNKNQIEPWTYPLYHRYCVPTITCETSDHDALWNAQGWRKQSVNNISLWIWKSWTVKF